jgi:hypothetical protein
MFLGSKEYSGTNNDSKQLCRILSLLNVFIAYNEVCYALYLKNIRLAPLRFEFQMPDLVRVEKGQLCNSFTLLPIGKP